MDAGGNLYGTTWYAYGGPNSTGNVFEVANGSNTIANIAYFSGTTGEPSGVGLDSQGNIFGSNGSYLYEIAKGSNAVTTLASLAPYGPIGVGSMRKEIFTQPGAPVTAACSNSSRVAAH